MTTLSLLRLGDPLANASEQVRVLAESREPALETFARAIERRGLPPLRARRIDVLQVNLGKVCNQTCAHCHVDAGPDRRESMAPETIEACLAALARSTIGVLDITGGAPEMHPQFRRLAREGRRLGRQVIDRCNLTILLAPGYQDLPQFLADEGVDIVASLPCYLEENLDRQRGEGVYAKSIEALRRLNALGYGVEGSGLSLSLVYNPVGYGLPPDQTRLEADYRRELRARHGIEFSRLFVITNMPISRFLADLLRAGKYESYMRRLIEAFNPSAVEGVMCRTMLSVDWQGNLYDCDFNQMLELGLTPGTPRHIRDFDVSALADRAIVTGRHCFGCTAGAGSSCQGATAPGV